MNLHFLDPSKLPDRIDSTLVIPRLLHHEPPNPKPTEGDVPAAKKSTTKEDLDAAAGTSCHAVAFSTNGTYLASGHASGLVPVHSFASRCLSALYAPPTSVDVPAGTTSLCWDNSGRYLLAGAYGDTVLRFMDNAHPSVAWECAEATRRVALEQQMHSGGSKSATRTGECEISLADRILHDSNLEPEPTVHLMNDTNGPIPLHLKIDSMGKGRLLSSRTESFGVSVHHQQQHSNTKYSQQVTSSTTIPCIRHPLISLQLPQPLGGTCQFHPTYDDIGVIRMVDSSLALVHIPRIAFYEMLPHQATPNDHDVEHSHIFGSVDMELRNLLEEAEANMAANVLYLTQPSKDDDAITSSKQYSVNCAAFGKGKHADILYAVTKCGSLLGFEITPSVIQMLQGKGRECQDGSIQPKFVVKLPGSASATQLVVNEKHLLMNSTDCALRLYNVDELWSNKMCLTNPHSVFQDLVSKAPFVGGDFSADGEYVVGGCNSNPPGDNYQLFIWNVVTGELLDQLTGPQVSLHCLSCHPTRPFIAVGSSDGMVDIWGYRTNWIAFAPDFQALQQNILYDEREDEFDIVIDDEKAEVNCDNVENIDIEDLDVDIITKMHESKNEFYFKTRVLKIIPEQPTKKIESTMNDA